MTREHLWEQLAEVDASRCVNCGIIASTTAISCGVWVVAEGSSFLPDCVEPAHDLDDDLARLLADDLPDAPEDLEFDE